MRYFKHAEAACNPRFKKKRTFFLPFLVGPPTNVRYLSVRVRESFSPTFARFHDQKTREKVNATRREKIESIFSEFTFYKVSFVNFTHTRWKREIIAETDNLSRERMDGRYIHRKWHHYLRIKVEHAEENRRRLVAPRSIALMVGW